MKKYSLKDKKTQEKLESLVDRFLVDPEIMNATDYYAKCKKNRCTRHEELNPKPMLSEEASDGESFVVGDETIHNPEYAYDNEDVAIYHKPDRSGDGYAPIQRELDPQYDQGYAPQTKTRSEEEEASCLESEIMLLINNGDVSPLNLIDSLNEEFSNDLKKEDPTRVGDVGVERSIEIIPNEKLDDLKMSDIPTQDEDDIKVFNPMRTPAGF